ncbi:serine/threonine protein kinase, partial [Tsukamurella sp. DT100]|uniref:serine/threonine protein kinase n=1 Tax=Tsukamurella sp. DT100 TaxID=3393415 RepID=UPI003CF410C1
EQASGEDATAASDVYSLGVVGYECLTGRPPFTAPTAVALCVQHIREEPPALPAWVPAGVDDVIMRALTKEPRRRFASGGELAEAITRARLSPTLRSGRTAAYAPTVHRAAAPRTVTRPATTPPIGSTAPTQPHTHSSPTGHRRKRSVAVAGALAVAAIALGGALAVNGMGDDGAGPTAGPTADNPGSMTTARTMAERPSDRVDPVPLERRTDPPRTTTSTVPRPTSTPTSPTSTSTTPTSTTTTTTTTTSTTTTTPTTTSSTTTTTASSKPQAESRV